MKKILSSALSLIAIAALFLGSAELPDGSMCVPWTFGCIGVFALCAIILCKLNPQKKGR